MSLTRIKVFILICILIPIGLLSFLVLRDRYKEYQDHLIIQSQTSLLMIEREVEGFVDNYTRLNRNIKEMHAQNVRDGYSDHEIYRSLASRHLSLNEIYRELKKLSIYPTLMTVAPKARVSDLFEISRDDDQLILIQNGSLHYYNPMQNDPSEGFRLVFSMLKIQERLKSLVPKPIGQVYLVDSIGNSIDPFDIYKYILPPKIHGIEFADICALISGQSEGFIRVPEKDLFLSFRVNPKRSRYYLMAIPENLVFMMMLRTFGKIIPFVFLALLLGGLLILYLNVALIHPLNNLAVAMDGTAVHPGSFMPSRSRFSELNTLHDQYFYMDQSLKKLIETVHQEHQMRQDSEIRALQAQICPHFLFNSLDTLYWAAQLKGNQDVGEMVMALSSLMDCHIGRDGQNLIPLAQELHNAESFLYLEKYRKDQGIRMTVQVAAELDHLLVPALILQPIIENSIRHNRRVDRDLELRILGSRKGDKVEISVSDNGTGVDVHELEMLRSRIESDCQDGVGLVNTHKRIRLHFGKEFGLSLENADSQGLKVVLSFPISGKEPSETVDRQRVGTHV